MASEQKIHSQAKEYDMRYSCSWDSFLDTLYSRAQVLGKPTATPVQRARAAAAATPATDTAKAVTQASEKIIVSNLPGDVNEAQVKVSQRFLAHFFFLISAVYRNCSTRQLDLSRKSPFITTPAAVQKVLPL